MLQYHQRLGHADEGVDAAAFLDVTSQVPSGLPHPDGTQRIRNIAHELAFARTELMRAHSRMDTFLVSGVAPDDIASGE